MYFSRWCLLSWCKLSLKRIAQIEWCRESFLLNPCMRDFLGWFCSNFLFFAENTHFFYDFFCVIQIKTRVFSKKIPQWRIFYRTISSSMGIWIDVLIGDEAIGGNPRRVTAYFLETKIRALKLSPTKIIKKYFNCYIWCYGLSPSCIAISADSLKLA